MDASIADYALKRAQELGASYAEVRLESVSSSEFILKNGVPQVSGFEQASGLGLRLLIKDALSFVSTNDLSKDSVNKLLKEAIRTSSAAARLSEAVRLSEEATNKAEYAVKQKKNVADVSPKEKLGLLIDIERSLASSGISFEGRFFSLSDSVTKRHTLTTEGTRVYSEIPRTNFYFFITVKEKGQSEQRYWQYGASGGFENVEALRLPELLLEEAKTMRRSITEGVKAPEGALDVVVAPQVTGIMVHESVGHPFEADRILGREAAQAGESFVTKDMLGTRLGSEVVNVVDDPTVPHSFGYFLYDEEGVRARKKYLVRRGMINEFLHNRATGALIGEKSNGSSRATRFDREAIVRMSNTFLEPGDFTEEELIEDVKLGVFIKNFTEWNIDDRRLNQKYVGSEAYLIKNGKLCEPVRNPTIEISTPELWKRVDAVAKNFELHAGTCGKGEPMQALPVTFGGASMRLRNVRLSQ